MLLVSRCWAVRSYLRNMSSGPLEWLASLQNWEQKGVPDGAGVKGGASSFELVRPAKPGGHGQGVRTHVT